MLTDHPTFITNENILFIRANVYEFRNYMYRYGRNNEAWNHTMDNNQGVIPVSCQQYTSSYLEDDEKDYPLLFSLHGYTSLALWNLSYTGFQSIADEAVYTQKIAYNAVTLA